jgi:hypothetical protein
MSKLRMIAATAAACLAAMGLSVGAALAEGEQTAKVQFTADGKPKQEFCFLHGIF